MTISSSRDAGDLRPLEHPTREERHDRERQLPAWSRMAHNRAKTPANRGHHLRDWRQSSWRRPEPSEIRPAVIFGSAAHPADHLQYMLAEKIAASSDAGFR